MTRRIDKKEFMPLIWRYKREFVGALAEDVLGMVLFGSVARNEATTGSDVDILSLLSRKTREIENRIVTLSVEGRDWDEYLMMERKGVRTRIYNICKTEAEIAENPLILLDVVDHGEILYDPRGCMKGLLDRFGAKMRELGTRKMVFPDGRWAWDLKPDWKPGEIVEVRL